MQRLEHPLLSPSIGSQKTLVSFRFGDPQARPKVYIQASLHAEELPGMLVAHHLRPLLEQAEREGRLQGHVVLVPAANPIGLAQRLDHKAMGRFELDTAQNFNRHYPDLADAVFSSVRDRLTPDAAANVALVRGAVTDWLASWLAVAAARDPQAQFEIVTRDDATLVRHALDPQGELANRLRIASRAPQEMPESVRAHDLSIMFFSQGLSKLGSSPTRMAEVLGCGLPVVANAGVGDVADIIQKWQVGILVEGPEPQQMAAALDALDILMQDPDLPSRCRKAAEAIFSLEAGTEAYRALYAGVLS